MRICVFCAAQIWTTSLLLVTALVGRVVLLLAVIANRTLVLETWQQWVAAFLYYWVLENAPALVRRPWNLLAIATLRVS